MWYDADSDVCKIYVRNCFSIQVLSLDIPLLSLVSVASKWEQNSWDVGASQQLPGSQRGITVMLFVFQFLLQAVAKDDAQKTNGENKDK